MSSGRQNVLQGRGGGTPRPGALSLQTIRILAGAEVPGVFQGEEGKGDEAADSASDTRARGGRRILSQGCCPRTRSGRCLWIPHLPGPLLGDQAGGNPDPPWKV